MQFVEGDKAACPTPYTAEISESPQLPIYQLWHSFTPSQCHYKINHSIKNSTHTFVCI